MTALWTRTRGAAGSSYARGISARGSGCFISGDGSGSGDGYVHGDGDGDGTLYGNGAGDGPDSGARWDRCGDGYGDHGGYGDWCGDGGHFQAVGYPEQELDSPQVATTRQLVDCPCLSVADLVMLAVAA